MACIGCLPFFRALATDGHERFLSADDIQDDPHVLAKMEEPKAATHEHKLPEGALRFALAAKKSQEMRQELRKGKGHQRLPSADSIMDPLFDSGQREAHLPVVRLLDLPDDVLLSLAGDSAPVSEVARLAGTCRRLSFLLEARCSSLLQKVRLPSVQSVRTATILLWQASSLSDDDMQCLAACLGQAPPLRALYLNENLVGDRGVRALSQSRALSRLRHLSLGSNFITDAGVGTLLQALEPGGTLAGVRELNLRGNPLTALTRLRVKALHDQNRMFVAS